MSAHLIQDELLRRLAASGKDNETFAAYIAYACDGEQSLALAIDERRAGNGTRDLTPPVHSVVRRLYLKSITVRAFRGIGPERTLKIDEGRGLTIVSGRNGSGKSSFAEAAELLFTNACSRFATPVAADGWRNRHETHPPLISAEVAVEDVGSATFSRKWGKDAALGDGETVVKTATETSSLGDTPWLAASVEYRPFLAYSQLGDMFDAKSQLHDALVRGLGVEEYEAVRTIIKKASTEREKDLDAAKDTAAEVIALATEAAGRADDDRLAQLVTLLKARTWDLDAIAAYVTDGAADDGRAGMLKTLAGVQPPDAGHATGLAAELRAADAASRRLDRLSAGRARQVADLLDKALEVTKAQKTADCPVCSSAGVIGTEWRERTEKVVGRLRADAADASHAAQTLQAARTRAVQFCVAPPTVLVEAAAAGLDVAALQLAWRQMASPVADEAPGALAARLETGVREIAERLAPVAAAARAELAHREDVWRPVAFKLAEWCPMGTRAAAGNEARLHLGKADKWLREEIVAIRAERFAPIEDKAREYWSMLRLQSSVELCAVKVVGSRTRRAVELEVRVDGSDSKALSVMSQGELNSLALSLFLPRATMPDTPFGFVLIDDPVQALDPSKVEGLARVLDRVAQTHQVIVFTHDDRLPEAVRRLDILATFVDLTRKDKSVIEVRRTRGPVKLLLADAVAVARTDHMPDGIKLRLVPSFCRSALEAACQEVVRARRLGRGDRHADVEAVLTSASGLRKLMALALFDDVEKAGDVERRLASPKEAAHGATFLACRDGAHGNFTGDPIALIDATESLVKLLRTRVALA